jgi:hypothetical protein
MKIVILFPFRVIWFLVKALLYPWYFKLFFRLRTPEEIMDEVFGPMAGRDTPRRRF